ncbi:YtxH domain-containing protein [Chitinophagaceae bacterium LB-8]|uniref:YtxH domain-containing protein n=1 Tax=Paraflavisolibacter caeni TaxID=2982496 RepID=A0A9X3B7P3_9BACT|nr:YtxH domain-containing protein [Paraflavisolibacter caeni]MCU7549530.1 YtxH domain-containing protein [Paraflavisolibacter caeni]
MTTRTKLILGIFGAAAAGAALGMLLAPDKGLQTRKNISKKAGDWANQLSDLFASAKEEIANMKKKGAKMTSEMAERYSGAADNFS